MRARKRCPFCWCLYWPDGRAAHRQWCCPKDECQKKRRVETQRRYRAKHPAEPECRRYRAAVASAKAGEVVAAPRSPPAAFGRLPWDEMRDEIAPQVAVTLAFFARLHRAARDEIGAQLTLMTAKFARLPPAGAEDEMGLPPPGG
jgi:hypothetical protein